MNQQNRLVMGRMTSILVIILLSSSSARPQENPPISFINLLRETEASFILPEGFRSVSVRDNPDVRYDFALASQEVKLEMRILLRPLKKDIAEHVRTGSAGPHPNAYHEALLLTMCLNLSGGNICEPRAFSPDDVQSEFKADAGFTTLVDLDSVFGRGFRHALINVFHRDGVGDIYVFFLFDDFRTVGSYIFRENVFHAITFK